MFYIYYVLLLISLYMHLCFAENHPQTNFLFIMFDDLRPEIFSYGRKHMITPNIDRLASKSVSFDRCFNQIAVCNPSRDSLLTGLRPDTVGTYGFQHSWAPHMLLPSELVKAGYNTAGFGKILHWETADKNIWSHTSYEGNWYDYQQWEWSIMNSSVTPDKTRTEKDFRDYLITTKAIKGLQEMASIYQQSIEVKDNKKINNIGFATPPPPPPPKAKHFMLSIGFKLPHLTYHIPYDYYALYKDVLFNATDEELSYPKTSPSSGYRCCGEGVFRYMNEEGAKRAVKTESIGDMNAVFPRQAYIEASRGYAAAITYVDTQVGRVLHELDVLGLWNSTTIILTSDHGFHNGEKGMYEKWTLFDEAGRVPLMIYHPLSPFKGMRYKHPVELIDVYPTALDLLQAHAPPEDCGVRPKTTVVGKCTPLQGKSLAGVVLGNNWDVNLKKRGLDQHYDVDMGVGDRNIKNVEPRTMHGRALAMTKTQASKSKTTSSQNQRLTSSFHANHGLRGSHTNTGLHSGNHHGKGHKIGQIQTQAQTQAHDYTHPDDIQFPHDFAITQFWRCLSKNDYKYITLKDGLVKEKQKRTTPIFRDCSMDAHTYNHVGVATGDNLMIMGYSMRTLTYRYTAWMHFNATTLTPILQPQILSSLYYDNNTSVVNNIFNTSFGPMIKPMFEELYKHELDINAHYTHEEMHNLAIQLLYPPPPSPLHTNQNISASAGAILNMTTSSNEAYEDYIYIKDTVDIHRKKLYEYIYRHIVYSGRH